MEDGTTTTSTITSQELLVLRDKVDSTWGDVCVGEYSRCYSLEKHKSVYLQFVCSKQWEFPAGATHMSVDCTADRQAKIEYVQRKKTHRHRKQIAIGVSISAGVAVALLVLWHLRRVCLRRLARAEQDGDNDGQQSRPVAIFSVMLCGYWCLIQKVVTSSSWERSGLLNAHLDGNLELSSVPSSSQQCRHHEDRSYPVTTTTVTTATTTRRKTASSQGAKVGKRCEEDLKLRYNKLQKMIL